MSTVTPDMYPDLMRTVKRIVRNAGTVIMTYFTTRPEIRYKSRFDMVTEADLASEKMILQELKIETPDVAVLAEESAASTDHPCMNRDDTWVIDPLDGTTNFAHGFPHFAISVALVSKGYPVLGMVFDPVRQEMFTAMAGCGAFLHDTRLQVSATDSLEKSLVATGFPYKIRELKQNNLMEFCAFRLECQGIRRFGAAALDLAYIAANRMDGFWERGLQPWDTAAGILLVTEAGGKVTRFDGSEYRITDPDIIATNGRIHAHMQQILGQTFPDLPALPRLSQ